MKTTEPMKLSQNTVTGSTVGGLLFIEGALYMYNKGNLQRIESPTKANTTTFVCGDIMKVY